MLTLSALLLPLGLLLPPPPSRAPLPIQIPAQVIELLTPGQPAVTPAPRQAVRPGPATWPLEPQPEVVAGFDPPEALWSAGHRGADLLGAPGQSVLAAMAGTVSFAGKIAGRGVVVINHGTQRTTYEPVLASVRVGERVPTGAVIGTLQTGRSHCAPRTCLHWGLLVGQTYLDPLSLLGHGPIRLLPY